MRRFLSAMALVLMASPVAAQPVITEPAWLNKPTSAQLMAAWPAEALRRGVGGRVVLACRVSAEGGLQPCIVKSETPAGAGFGGAALALTPQFRMKPMTRDGQPVSGAVVAIPIVFMSNGVQQAMGAPVTALLRPPWVAGPTRAEIAAAYPAEAAAARIVGRAALRCTVARGGGLRQCQVLSETPQGQGFAHAALHLTDRFRVAETLASGRPTHDAILTVPIAFTADLLTPEGLQAGPKIDTLPEWTSLPQPEEVKAAYPAAARSAGLQRGSARLGCTVQPDGALGGCSVLQESPEKMGFGEAALRLSSRFILSLWTADGTPTAGAYLQMPLSIVDQTAAPAGAPKP